MGEESRLAVINRDGWEKEYLLKKNIIHIGSDARSDIILEEKHGSGVAPLHIQLIAIAEGGQSYRLVNLGYTDIILGPNGERTLPPRATHDLAAGDKLKVGDFTLIYQGQSAAALPATSTGQRIGLSLFMARTQIAPHQSASGVLTVRNLGDKGGVKINLELEGLEPDCYHLEPGPMLSSGAEKEVLLFIRHYGHKPLAGTYPIKIHATAPNAYPADFVSVSQTIQILPFYSHKLRLLIPDEAKARQVAAPPPAPESIPVAVTAVEPVPELPVPLAPALANSANGSSTPAPESNPAPAVTSADDWWAAEAEPEPQVTLVSSSPLVTPPPSAVEPAAEASPEPQPKEDVASHEVEVVEVEAKELPPVAARPAAPAVAEQEIEVVSTLSAAQPALPVEPDLAAVEITTTPVEVQVIESALSVEAQISPAPPVQAEPVRPAEPSTSPVAEEATSAAASGSPLLPAITPQGEQPERLPDQPALPETPAMRKEVSPAEPAPESPQVKESGPAMLPVKDEARRPAAPETKPRRPRTKTSAQAKIKIEPKPVADPPAEDWWGEGSESGPAEAEDKPKAIKLKASAQAPARETAPPTQAGAAPQDEDWWADSESK